MAAVEWLEVEVAYVPAEGAAFIKRLEVPVGTHVRGVIERARILDACPEIDLSRWRVGIFGQLVTLEDEVGPEDRVEIYRPLERDPRESRRRRASAVGR